MGKLCGTNISNFHFLPFSLYQWGKGTAPSCLTTSVPEDGGRPLDIILETTDVEKNAPRVLLEWLR